jgi:hypothetical protein
MRIQPCVAMCLAAFSLVGCEMPMFSGGTCWDSYGCDGSPWGIPGPSAYIVGFPAAKLDTTAIATGGGMRGLLQVGDSITLYVLDAANFPDDTVRSVGWSADTATARIAERADGGLTLVATASGPVQVYTAVGAVMAYCPSAANTYGCVAIAEIDVSP